MNNGRKLFFIFLIVLGTVLCIAFTINKITPPVPATLSPVFQMMGIYSKSVDRIISRMVPVDDLDEKEFGEALTERYMRDCDTESSDYIYLNVLISNLSLYSVKPFDYHVFSVSSDEPNAFALPGGVILVTTGLLDTLETEGELVAVLAHEMGHIELSHCFDAVRFELLAGKKGSIELGQFTDSLIYFFAGHTFSKTMEEEADRYGFELLLMTIYDPYSTAEAFRKLNDYYTDIDNPVDSRLTPDIVRDYFSSHPPLEIRISRYENLARKWWTLNNGATRYIGKKNLLYRETYYNYDFGSDEWVVY